jgi:hypothetical protein
VKLWDVAAPAAAGAGAGASSVGGADWRPSLADVAALAADPASAAGPSGRLWAARVTRAFGGQAPPSAAAEAAAAAGGGGGGGSAPLASLADFSGAATAAALSADGRVAVACSDDGQVTVWDVRTRHPVRTWEPHGGNAATHLQLLGGLGGVGADGNASAGAPFGVLTASGDGTVRLWDLGSVVTSRGGRSSGCGRRPVRGLLCEGYQSDPVTALASFVAPSAAASIAVSSASGAAAGALGVLTGDAEGRVRLWDFSDSFARGVLVSAPVRAATDAEFNGYDDEDGDDGYDDDDTGFSAISRQGEGIDEAWSLSALPSLDAPAAALAGAAAVSGGGGSGGARGSLALGRATSLRGSVVMSGGGGGSGGRGGSSVGVTALTVTPGYVAAGCMPSVVAASGDHIALFR